MKKLNVAIIGQGRSGKKIHGTYFRSADNLYYNVKYVVDADAHRREVAEAIYPGCTTFAAVTDLYACNDIDLVVNASFSEMHYSITKDLLLHGFNVLVEKPFGKTRYECEELIKIAKEKNVTLAVFQQTFFAPFYTFAYELAKSGKLGDIKQVSIRYNSFSRRWDWQTLQKKCAGGVYNTGPHPIGLALDFLDFSDDLRVAYSKLDCAFTSGDANDMAKIILVAPGKPVVEVQVNSNDPFSNYNLKVLGTKGCLQSTINDYKLKYIVDGENPEQPVQPEFLRDENGLPMYCREQLKFHEEEGSVTGTAFAAATASFYEMMYESLVNGAELKVKPENIAKLVNVMEIVHAQNPLPVTYYGGKHV